MKHVILALILGIYVTCVAEADNTTCTTTGSYSMRTTNCNDSKGPKFQPPVIVPGDYSNPKGSDPVGAFARGRDLKMEYELKKAELERLQLENKKLKMEMEQAKSDRLRSEEHRRAKLRKKSKSDDPCASGDPMWADVCEEKAKHE